jgi:hypothetical protein
MFTDKSNKWCRPCQINNLKQNFTKWTSGNEKINEIIQEIQLKINKHSDIIVEWISYNQFNNIKEISKNDSTIVCSAIWRDGPLHYDYEKEYARSFNQNVILKCLLCSQNITHEFLDKV